MTLFDGGRLTGLCPSCRLAGRWGSYLAFTAWLVYKLATMALG